MIQHIRMSEPSHLSRAEMALRGIKWDGKEYEMTIGPYELDRSSAQKGYYFRIVGIIAQSLGWDREDLHSYYKVQYLMPLYMADLKKAAYQARIADIEAAHAAGVWSAQKRDGMFAAVTSTNDAKMKQMRELIDCVQRHAAEMGVRLPVMEWEQ